MATLREIRDYLRARGRAGRVSHLSILSASMAAVAIEKVIRAEPAPLHPAERLPYRIEKWDPTGNHIDQPLAFLADLTAAKAAWERFVITNPYDYMTLRHGTFLIAKREWSDRCAPNGTR